MSKITHDFWLCVVSVVYHYKNSTKCVGPVYIIHPSTINHHLSSSSPPCRAQWLSELGLSLDLTAHTSLSPIRRGFTPGFVNSYKKQCTRLAAASDKVYQLLAHMVGGSLRLLPPQTGRPDITEILLKVA